VTPDRRARLWWWIAIAAAILLGLKLGAGFWAIHQGTRAPVP
jgi:hypothetical protein